MLSQNADHEVHKEWRLGTRAVVLEASRAAWPSLKEFEHPPASEKVR